MFWSIHKPNSFLLEITMIKTIKNRYNKKKVSKVFGKIKV